MGGDCLSFKGHMGEGEKNKYLLGFILHAVAQVGSVSVHWGTELVLP